MPYFEDEEFYDGDGVIYRFEDGHRGNRCPHGNGIWYDPYDHRTKYEAPL